MFPLFLSVLMRRVIRGQNPCFDFSKNRANRRSSPSSRCVPPAVEDIAPDKIVPIVSQPRFVLCAALLLGGACAAQWQMDGRSWGGTTGSMVQTEGNGWVNEDTVRTARETAPHSVDLPVWTNPPAFQKDVFVFIRVIFKSAPGGPSWLGTFFRITSRFRRL
jgi:hypothetical protein